MTRIFKPGEPGFYINRRNYVESESEALVGVCGFFFGRAIKPGVGVVREFGFKIPNPNLVTNTGMDAIGNGDSWRYMHLGTGTTTPNVTDTSLGVFGVNVSIVNPAGSYANGEDSGVYYGGYRYTYTSNVGGATGIWREIGISKQATDGGLNSHALILDGSGNPAAFPVQNDEQFEGTYELRFYPPTEDAPATITLGSNTYDTISRALGASSNSWGPNGFQNTSTPGRFALSGGTFSIGNCRPMSGDLNSATDTQAQGSPVGTGSSTTGSAAYSAGNYYRDHWVRFGSGTAVGNIRTLELRGVNLGAMQVRYDPVIAKLTSEEVIHYQRYSWARR